MKYTKGKWEIRGNSIIAKQSGYSIELAKLTPFHQGESEANARLIAAAPNMYEALKGIVAKRMENHETEAAYIPPETEAVYKALAKAEGK